MKTKSLAKILVATMILGLMVTATPAAPGVVGMLAAKVVSASAALAPQATPPDASAVTAVRTAEKTISLTTNVSGLEYTSATANALEYATWAKLTVGRTTTITLADERAQSAVTIYIRTGAPADGSTTASRPVPIEVPKYGEAPSPTPTGEAGGNPSVNEKADTSVVVSYKDYTATITTGSDARYAFLEVLKDEAGTKVSGLYAYELTDNKIIVDLSFLKAAKKSYIRVYNNTNMVPSAVTTIEALPAKLKLKFVAGKNTVAESFENNKVALNEKTLALYEYRTMYGTEWKSLAEFDLANTIVAGTTLVVREKATNVAPAGTEVRVKVKAIAKAPKIGVDYTKGQIALKKGTEINILYNNAELAEWVTISDGNAGKKSLEDLLKLCTELKSADDAIVNGFTLMVRTKATTSKPASNIAFLNFEKQITIAKTEDADEVKAGNGVLTWKATDAGIEFTATNADFEYQTSGNEKWVAIKAGKTLKVKNARTADTVYTVRLAGNKTESTMPSAECEITLAKAEVKE
ncbi:MAG: hypothetical protein IJY09_06570 [Lachnospiraceae bacterium]|nr:hypothetical protein [Lachnospiraceae bacterium]